MKKPQLKDFELSESIDPTGELAYNSYKKAKNDYAKNKRANTIEQSWRSYFRVSNSEESIIGNMTCSKCQEKISGYYLVEEKSNFMLRGNEHDKWFIYHRDCSSDNVEWAKFDAMGKSNQIEYTPEPWQFHENGDGSFSILNHDKSKWVIGLHLNGEMTIHKQRAVMMRIVSCVNSCKNVPNEWLQENAVYARIDEVEELKKNAIHDKHLIDELKAQNESLQCNLADIGDELNAKNAKNEKLIQLLERWQNEWVIDGTPAQKANNYSIEMAIKEAIDESKRFASDESAL